LIKFLLLVGSEFIYMGGLIIYWYWIKVSTIYLLYKGCLEMCISSIIYLYL